MALNIKKEFNKNRKPDISSLVYGKVPPQVPEIEEAVLGAAMLEKESFATAIEVIPSEDCFYVDAHQKIYAAMRRLSAKGDPIDLLTITEELRKTNELEAVGGAYYLTNLTMSVLSSAHIEAHSKLVMESFFKREMIRVGGTIVSDGYNDDCDVFDLIDKASDEFYNLQTRSVTKVPQSIASGVQLSLDHMEELRKSVKNFTGIDTGFKELNELTNGWQKTDLTIIAARPSVGKTAFTIALIMAAAASGKPSALFSLEMSREQIIKRMKASISGVEMSQINNPKNMTQDEWDRLYEAAAIISKMQIYIDDTAGLTAFELRAKAKRLRNKNGVELIGIDYLQLMSGTGKEGNREQEISKISREIKVCAKETETAILALSQLNRGIEGQSGEATRDPKLSDLRESGAIEQDADNVFFLTNPTAKLLSENSFFAGKKLVTCAKGRNIGLGQIALEFNSSTQKWRDPIKPDVFEETKPDNPRAGFQQTRPVEQQWNNK